MIPSGMVLILLLTLQIIYMLENMLMINAFSMRNLSLKLVLQEQSVTTNLSYHTKLLVIKIVKILKKKLFHYVLLKTSHIYQIIVSNGVEIILKELLPQVHQNAITSLLKVKVIWINLEKIIVMIIHSQKNFNKLIVHQKL